MPATLDAIGKSDVMGRDGFTWWVGEVEDIEDPQKIGRTKVRIIGWYTGTGAKQAYTKEVPTEDLPWAITMLPTNQAGIKNTGAKCELQVGAQVLGFFLDGEEAQLPVVMGNIRGFKNLSDSKSPDGVPSTEQKIGATSVADSTKAVSDDEMSPQSKTYQGEVSHGGNSFVVVAGDTPGDEFGGEEKSRGIIPKAAQDAPGNVYTNPMKIPADAQGVADGLSGPGGVGFEKDLTRMLNEFGQLSGSIAKDPAGNLISIITGKKLRNDVLDKGLAGISEMVSNAISGVMSALKNILAKQLETMVNGLMSALTSVIPLGIVQQLLKLASFITSLFCGFEGNYILGAIAGAMGDIKSFASDVSSNIVDKVVGGLASKVQDTVDGVIGKIQGAMGKVAAMASKVQAAIAVAQKGIAIAKKAGAALKSLFEFDFSKMNWGSLISIILGILKMLFGNKDCGRSHSPPKQKFWLPLLGSSTCETVPEFLQQEIEIDTGSGVGSKTKGDYFSTLMQGIDAFKVQAQTSMNGAITIQDNTPGKEKTIVQHAGGQTTIATAHGDQHQNLPGNTTAIIGRDEAKSIKGNKLVTVEGDYTLKVMGNFNIEVGGTHNLHVSQGVGDGGSKQKKAATTYASDYDVSYEGDYKIQAPNITFNALNEFSCNASTISNKATSLMNSISGEIINECAWKTEFVNNVHFLNIGMLNPLPAITGQVNLIKGPQITINGTGIGPSPMPAAQINICECTVPGGIIDVVNGSMGGRLSLVNTGKGGIGEFVTAAGGAIMNNVTNGVATYNVNTGVFTAGCGAGPAQFYGLPILLN